EQAASRWRTLTPKDHRPYIFLARHAAGQGDKERMLKELDALVTMNPDDSQYKLIRAAALEDFGFIEDAQAAFGQLPPETEMLRAQAGFWQRRQNAENAQKALEQVLAKNPNDVEALLQLSHVLVTRGDIAGAMDRLDKALQRELIAPDREKLMLAKASLKADQNEFDAANTLCAEVLKQNQGNMDAHFLLGQLSLRTGKTEDAELHLNQVAVSRPNDASALILLARTQRLNKKDSLAFDTLRNALSANKENLDIRMELVDTFINQKDYDQALKLLDQGLEIKPNEPMLLNRRGDIHAVKKDYKKAESDFRELVRVQPNSPAGYLKLGQFMLNISKPDEAIEAFGKALRAEDAWHLALPGIVNAYLLKKDTKAALAAVEVEVRKRPQAPIAHYYLAQVLVKTGALDKAEPPILEAIKLAPEWIDPYRALTDLYAARGKGKDAQKKLEELHKKNPTPAAILTLALFYEQESKTKDADRLYSELLEKTSKAPGVLNDIAFLHAEHRKDPQDLKKAAEMAAQALSKQPENVAYLDTVAWISYKQGKLDEAWNRLKQVLLRHPDAPSINLHAAVVAHARGEKETARQHLDKVIGQEADPYSQRKALSIKKEWES
ncbi:MAG: tetratricopeptide repeat protein, partial [Syntrophobacteraceae bacterium]